MIKSLLSFLLLFIGVSAFANNNITGKIVDSSNKNESLPGVVVMIKSNGKGDQSDIDGKFMISDLKNGKYEISFSMMGYKTKLIPVTIEGKDIELEVFLTSNSHDIKEVKISGTKVTHTEASVVMAIKQSTTLVSGIGSSQIAKTMDRNAADVVKRVPGVTVQDDKFINVRGLYDRYNTVWLNDAGAPSAEVDKKSFSFDIIPSGLIDRIFVYKSPAAELPGDFAGGMVKVYTTSIADKNQFSVGFQTSYRQNATGQDFWYNRKSSTDWLGFDDGGRSIPNGTPDRLNKAKDANSISNLFNNDWQVFTKKLNPDMRFNMSASNIWKVGKVRFGNTFGLAYSSVSTAYSVHRTDFDSLGDSPIYDYNDKTYNTTTNVGIIDNIAAVFGNNKIEFKNLYNQTGKASLVYRSNNFIPDAPVADERSYAMGYESRAVYSTQLSGTHKTNDGSRKYTWALGYNDLFKNQPDLKRIKFTKDPTLPDSMYAAPVPNGAVDPVNGGGRLYMQLYENVYSFNHQFTQKFNVKRRIIELNVGNYLEYKSRYFYARTLGYTVRAGAYSTNILKRSSVNDIFSSKNVGQNVRADSTFKLDESTSLSDHYSGQNKLIASFISLKIPITMQTNAIIGVRNENNTQSLQSVSGTDTVEPSINTNYFLPSLNLTYNFTEKKLLRFAYGKTLNRPEFREWSPFYFYDFENRADVYGSLNQAVNDTLKVAQIQNFDLRYEFYPSAGEVLHVGVFYKTFKNPIQQILLLTSADNKAFTFANADKAYSLGAEIELRKNLTFLDDLLHSNVFSRFTLTGNASFIKSGLSFSDAPKNALQLKNSPLQGQSPYVVNLGLFYQNDSLVLQGSLLYNVYGPRMFLLGRTGLPSIGELPFNSLDLTLSKTFHKHYVVSFGIQNLLDQTLTRVEDNNQDGKFKRGDDKVFSSFKPGRYYSLGFRIRI
ncbi:MAG: TonB-dependent receptor [Phycisphaerales bacterium]|nr:TonB-dependent receptor [Phycisphaerales bacterium]